MQTAIFHTFDMSASMHMESDTKPSEIIKKFMTSLATKICIKHFEINEVSGYAFLLSELKGEFCHMLSVWMCRRKHI
jgi:hypothetical protein